MAQGAVDRVSAVDQVTETGYRVLEPSPRRVRAAFAGETVADGRMMLMGSVRRFVLWAIVMKKTRSDPIGESMTGTVYWPRTIPAVGRFHASAHDPENEI